MNGMLVPCRIWIMVALGLDAELLDLAPAEHGVEDHPSEQYRGEHVGDQADAERDREALDRPRAELEQEQGADQRRQVRIQNGAERAVVAELDRLAHALVVAQLFA